MSLLAYPLAAMAGGLLGTVAHECTHYLVARALGTVERVGWQGGVTGRLFIDFRVGSRWRSEAVRKAPLAVGVAGVAALVVGFDGPTLPWATAAGAVAGLLWSSPEDLFLHRADQAEPTETQT